MSQFISLEEAVAMTTLYREEKEKILADAFKGQNILCICETFDKDVIEKLLAKPGCAALRIYYGMDESLKVHAIIVAVNEKNEDILPKEAGLKDPDTGDDIAEQSRRCPDDCPPESPLNP
ncbi:MAG TPA: hypothetical protein PKA77_07715 [Chitinophagaceae bacterium]|jgi:hypothetical protein|nr:hypothetical protein [Chitinophagaceae bacterium]HMU57264.1 hypothetical protein [Chitinophagaceae bacterium]